MAEAVAIGRLIASIGTLIDLSAKVASRLQEFSVKSSDVPKSFRTLRDSLLLLPATLQNISKAETGRTPDDVTRRLEAVVVNTSEQISIVQKWFSEVLPTDADSRSKRTSKALKSLSKENKLQHAVEIIDRNVASLGLYQTTRNEVTISEALSKFSVTPPVLSKSFGVCLGQAPQITADAFIGRNNELRQLREWLLPKERTNHQRTVSLWGLGGLGKTQLSLAHVRQCADDYSSVFWMNAKDETSLRKRMVELSATVIHEPASAVQQSQTADDEKHKIDRVRRWLSQSGNDQWLLIFDNYDDPSLPGVENQTGFDIRPYFPHRSQGSILITTRSPKLHFAQQLPLKKLKDIEESLAILADRSSRKVDGDASAKALVLRLDGLPLALTTAGAYLSQSADSFDDYLEMYNNNWIDLGKYSQGPMEYPERTMYSTWNVSFQQVQAQDPVAAELLTLMAYLENQDLWYELFAVEVKDAPAWWIEMSKSRARFNQAMMTLHNSSLLEVSEGHYSLHPCEHDWILEHLNRDFDQERCRIAIHCVAENVREEIKVDYWVENWRLVPHARRFRHNRIHAVTEWSGIEPDDLRWIAYLYEKGRMSVEAEGMYMEALEGFKKSLGLEHNSTLQTFYNLGRLYLEQGKFIEAEKMCMQALQGFEKILGSEHKSTLDTVYYLGILYQEQGKIMEAEEMFVRVLQGYEKILGFEDKSTLDAAHNLAMLYKLQGRFNEAEKMFMQALQGYKKILGSEHLSTLVTVNNLGNLYKEQGRLIEAEKMYMQALQRFKKTLGFEHILILRTINKLCILYKDQGRLIEAEQMYMGALQGYKKILGSEHTSTLNTLKNLGVLYNDQRKIMEAESLPLRTAQGSEKTVGKDRPTTQMYARNLDPVRDKKAKALGDKQTKEMNRQTKSHLARLFSVRPVRYWYQRRSS